MYSVVVQNELFHNGNVEAWKRIIDSYTTKYPGLEVYIYYDGERIMNINSLFKMGKGKTRQYHTIRRRGFGYQGCGETSTVSDAGC